MPNMLLLAGTAFEAREYLGVPRMYTNRDTPIATAAAK
jgi:hypothetical protein